MRRQRLSTVDIGEPGEGRRGTLSPKEWTSSQLFRKRRGASPTNPGYSFGVSTLRFPSGGASEGSAGMVVAPFFSSSLATGTVIPEDTMYRFLLSLYDTARV